MNLSVLSYYYCTYLTKVIKEFIIPVIHAVLIDLNKRALSICSQIILGFFVRANMMDADYDRHVLSPTLNPHANTLNLKFRLKLKFEFDRILQVTIRILIISRMYYLR